MNKQLKFRGSVIRALATTLIFTVVLVPNSFAHNIDLDKAWEMARDYARLVRRESNGGYKHYATNCVKAFPGHNHYVRCMVSYQTEKDAKAQVWSCKETIEFSHDSHNRGISYVFYYKHTSSSKCGRRLLQTIPRSELGY